MTDTPGNSSRALLGYLRLYGQRLALDKVPNNMEAKQSQGEQVAMHIPLETETFEFVSVEAVPAGCMKLHRYTGGPILKIT